MATDLLLKVFKTLTDPTRMRLLALLEREELAVQELTEILGTPQSTVSRHLGILREAGLLRDRREGTHAYYSFLLPADPVWHDAWEMTRAALADDPDARADAAALAAVFRARAARTRAWFDSVGPEWDVLRRVFNDDAQRARAITKLVPSGLRVADIGTGTGVLAIELARAGLDVVAVDHADKMLAAAHKNAAAAGLATRIQFRAGAATALPLADAEVDAVFAHMVLQYLPRPQDAVAEMARVLRPGGRVVLVDFVAHDRTWMQHKLNAHWLGFAPEMVHEWLTQAGFDHIAVEVQEPEDRDGDLPATFIASAVAPQARP
ncbi:MAG: metalloregulator ArsR/SmtB family transcription factor [Planctomycetota bacterium]